MIIELFPSGESPACCITRPRLTNAPHPTNPANRANSAEKLFSLGNCCYHQRARSSTKSDAPLRAGGGRGDLAGLPSPDVFLMGPSLVGK